MKLRGSLPRLIALALLLSACSLAPPPESDGAADPPAATLDQSDLLNPPTPLITPSPGGVPVATDAPALVTREPPPETPTIVPIEASLPAADLETLNTPAATAAATPCAIPAQIVTGSFASSLNGGLMSYKAYLPPCYGLDGRQYPVLYMFHGNATDDRHWDALGLDEAASVAIGAAQIPPLIIVMPNGNPLALNTSGGPYSFEGAVLNEMIPFIEATYCAWPHRDGRAVGGLSRGGYWALEIAFRHPDAFASVGGHSAALVDTYAGPDLNPQYTGLSRDLSGVRIYLDIGQEDWYRGNLQRLHEDLDATGVAHTWVLNEGGHSDAYWSAHVGDYLAWYAQSWPSDRMAYGPCDSQAQKN